MAFLIQNSNKSPLADFPLSVSLNVRVHTVQSIARPSRTRRTGKDNDGEGEEMPTVKISEEKLAGRNYYIRARINRHAL